ncbi:CDP-glycerol glycerophosphotransferase family protein [Arcobacter sp. LA11]|uniref:CDP-glycerol glycerophosphotransferase family protein n=1 Tax=Arcobacter sp. LA11 TaxID=1898176 RepID=UPI0009330204|nr:CDP-glycerol glycerophosphotransferase family protein [Arcobacter sp. LA11]
MNYKNCEIVAYFCGGINSYYQIKQWQKPFEELNKKHKLLYVITDYEVYLHFIKEQVFEVVYIQDFTNLIELYQENEFSITLYINNSLKNFQALRYSRGYHIHLNHGESEKESMRSNQSQAYDYIFTVGQRGVDRYAEYLLNFNSEKFIKVGRPQLDFINQLEIKKNKKQRVILYAPTWEATHPSMNYTSVPLYGVTLVKEILKNKNNILIYKPHSALGTRDEDALSANNEILQIISQSSNAYYMGEDDINDVFTLVDFAFFDNTSVMIDYLYTNKPAAYMEVLEDQSINELRKAFKTIDRKNFENFIEIMEDEILNDTNKKARKKVKEYYLGNYKKGESTKIFINKISEYIKIRNKKVKNLKK